jgi:glycerol kinase
LHDQGDLLAPFCLTEGAAGDRQKAAGDISADGWEHDPENLGATLEVCREALRRRPEARPLAIGITNQRETTIVWDRRSGKPVHNAIVWQDRRGAPLAAGSSKGMEPTIQAKTGLLIDSYFSATKVAWVLENVEGAMDAAKCGDLAFGTVDSFLLWRLTGGKSHATDAANASRTMLYNIRSMEWDPNFWNCSAFRKACSRRFATTRRHLEPRKRTRSARRFQLPAWPAISRPP